MKKMLVSDFIVKWVIATIVSLLMVSVALAQTEVVTVNSLEFDPNNYTDETLTIGDWTINYHAYKNIVYVSKPVNTDYQILNVFLP